ncbi:RDD domain containing protein [Crinalium epipsammum PCC 9333]|uniref:RDD domain containing protein n=1 Tax=Crinalium epipsammum PCC 9333 TaxID=1173022 RepID=K9W572_9CYAN|nr:RDD family protein [Crinalium epipsammum]AFZ14585.1 RDD domain containing protein [Crinalium epipsammum PCC 9333]
MNDQLGYSRFPKVPIQRRVAAFIIDFLAVSILSVLLGGTLFANAVIFLLAWLVLRVVLVSKNQGQSLGRYALDMKVVNAKFGKTPGFVDLALREGIAGFVSMLALVGLIIGLSNAISLLLLISPLVADCGLAFTDADLQQAFHDRISQTQVVATRRGFSLDLKIKKILADTTRNMK